MMTLVVVSAHTTPGGRVRLRLSDGTTARVARSSRLAQLRKGDRVDPARLTGLVLDRWAEQCHYPGCERPALDAWTTCGRHQSAGKSTKQVAR